MAYPNTIGEIKNEVLVLLGTSTSVAFYTDTILNNWVDKAHKWAAGVHKWPFTEGRVSTTYASLATNEDGDLVGEYPEGWKSDSIRYLTIGGKVLKKTLFQRFRQFREERSSQDDKIFTDYGRLYYVNPNTALSGTVTAWGQFTPADLDGTDPNSETIFSPTETGNEAIVEKVLEYARIREGNPQEAQLHSARARTILEELWMQWKDEQFGYQDHNVSDGMFKRIDFLSGATEFNHRDRFY